MTPNQLSDKVEGIVSKAEKVFGSQINVTQKALFEQISLLLNKLDLNIDGTIKQSQANRMIMARADEYFNKAFNQSGYYQSLGNFTDEILSITAANEAYFTTVLDTFSIDAQYLKSLQKQSISQLESLLANEGLESQVKQPILNILNQNINTGAKFSDLNQQVKDFIIGNVEREGRLKSYASQITYDTLYNYSRALQEAISTNSNLQFIVYLGGLVKDSRDFCIEKAGNYYHYKEVEEWASGDWAGKRSGTTESAIFIFAGGYRCEHQIIYVSEFVVPNDVIQRAKELGFYEK